MQSKYRDVCEYTKQKENKKLGYTHRCLKT